MKKKMIILGSLFVALLLTMLPSCSAVQSTQDAEKEIPNVFEKLDIPQYIWFAIYILILSLANRLMNSRL